MPHVSPVLRPSKTIFRACVPYLLVGKRLSLVHIHYTWAGRFRRLLSGPTYPDYGFLSHLHGG
jgi:hypothetical protein